MKALFLFSGPRDGLVEKVHKGEYHGNGFWGMLQLPRYGVEADYVEIEQFFSAKIARYIRRYVNVYAIHLPLFFKIFSYDIVFTSAAFGSQLLHAFLHIKKPIWIMHDFSIMGLLGNETSMRQKLFRYMVLRSKGVVTLSIDEQVALQKRFPHLKGRVEFIPFGVDLNFFKPRGLPEKRQVLAVGFDPDRDWGTLIEACKQIDIPVIVATRESRVKKYLPLPANIHVQQFSPRELVDAYEQSMLVVVPLNTSLGTNDAMGCSTLFEAMAVGKPVVITRTRATESYVTHGVDGMLVAEANIEEMRIAIKMIIDNEGLRKSMGIKAREYAGVNLDIEKCSEKLACFFKRIVKLS